MTVIIAKAKRLPPALPYLQPNSSELDINLNKFIDIRSPSLRQNHPGPNKSLYSYNYNTDTGIHAQEYSHLNNVGTDQETLEVHDNYNYTDNNGNVFQISYTADENGFQPKSAHLHTVPPLIKKALQYITENPEENGK